MRISKFLLPAFIFVCLCGQVNVFAKDLANDKVRIFGTMVERKNSVVNIYFNGAEALMGKSRDFQLRIDANGNFDTTLVIDKPVYYMINRNTVYLTPGDVLECHIKEDSELSYFKGSSQVANNYLIHRAFPKGGSFLLAGRNIKENFDTTIKLISEEANVKYTTIKGLKGVSNEFKAMETARITADLFNSYLSYPSYAKEFREYKSVTEYSVAVEAFYNKYAKDMNALLKEINKDEFVDVECVRYSVLKSLSSTKQVWFDLKPSPVFQEVLDVKDIKSLLEKNISKENIVLAKKKLELIKSPSYIASIEAMIKNAGTLVAGYPAIDFSLTTVDGKTLKLSDLKGKILYLDIWATWCGPCKGEAPYFEALADEFASKDILFIPISNDEKLATWQSYLNKNPKKLTQYNTVDINLTKGWNIEGIPRFMLIDKDFNIINANAPRPSDPKTKELLKELLSK